MHPPKGQIQEAGNHTVTMAVHTVMVLQVVGAIINRYQMLMGLVPMILKPVAVILANLLAKMNLLTTLRPEAVIQERQKGRNH